MAAPLTACAFCGRDNDPASRYCIDCGKPIATSAARVIPMYSGQQHTPSGRPRGVLGDDAPVPGAAVGSGGLVPVTRVSPPLSSSGPTCPRCARVVDPSMPFCAGCGSRVTPEISESECDSCGATYTVGVDLFCARCGHRVGQRVSVAMKGGFGTLVLGNRQKEVGPRLSLLDEVGDVVSSYSLERGEAVVGRGDADITFDDVYLSPLHARFDLREGELWVRDLGSRNGTWTFIEQPTKLADGDVVLVGSQLLRFRRLGYPGPHPPEADATRRMGSLVPSADIAVLEQLRGDGSVRDTFHLSPARAVMLGRESGDWVFPYDQTMSGRHAEIRSQDADFFVSDAGSRNGVAIAVRGERTVKKGQRILIGDQVLRVDSIG